MVDTEARSARRLIDPALQAKDELKPKIEKAKTDSAIKIQLINEVKEEMKSAALQREEVIAQEVVSGEKADMSQVRDACNSAIAQVLLCVKENIIIPVATNKSFFNQLADAKFGPYTAFHLTPIVNKYLDEVITFSSPGDPQSLFEQDFQRLASQNANAANVLKQCLINSAADFRLTPDNINTKLTALVKSGVEETKSEQMRKLLEEDKRDYILGLLDAKKVPQDFDLSERKIWDNYLNILTNNVEPSTKQQEALKTILNKYGFTPEQSEEIITHLEKSLIIRNAEGLIHAISERGFISLTDEEKDIIRKYFFDTQGLLEIIGAGDEFSNNKRLEFKRKITAIFNKLYSKIDEQPNKQFREEFSDLYEGSAFRSLIHALNQLRNKFEESKKIVNYKDAEGQSQTEKLSKFLESFIREINIERNWREIYHDIWIYVKMPESIEKWKEYIGYLGVSEISIFLSGLDGKAVDIARASFERYLQFKIAQNGNRMSADFLAGFFDPTTQEYGQPDYENSEKYCRTVLQASGFNLTDLELKRVLTIARGFTLINTLRIPEIVASSLPPGPGDFKGNVLWDLAAFFNKQFQWGQGRALYDKDGQKPTQYMQRVPELPLIPVVSRPEFSFWKRILAKGRARKWVPREIWDEAFGHQPSEKELERLMTQVDREWLDNMGSYGKLIRIFSIGGFHTRAGWRLEGLKDLKDKIAKNFLTQPLKKDRKFEDENEWLWNDFYLIKEVGAAAGWYYDKGRAEEELKHAVGALLQEKKIINKPWEALTDKEWDKLWSLVTGGHLDDIKLKVFKVDKPTPLSELIENRGIQYQGYTFYKLLRRSPLDFLTNLSQLVPELSKLQEDPNAETDKKLGTKATKSSYWFIDNPDDIVKKTTGDNEKNENQHRKEVDTVKKFQASLKRKWGENNYQHLKRVALFWEELDKNEISGDEFRNIMSIAVEKLKTRTSGTGENVGYEMIKEDIQDIKISSITEEKINCIAGLFFDNDRLISYFKILGDQEKQNLATDYKPKERLHQGQLQTDTFFYTMGQLWFRDDQSGVFPNSAEIDHTKVFAAIAKAGENENKRLVGDIPVWNKATEGISHLDKLLVQANQTKKLDKIMELHHNISEMQGIIGLKDMYKAQFYLSQIVARFFQVHDAAVWPLGAGQIAKLFLGRDVSLSKLHFGYDAFTMDSDDINAYFRQLWMMGVLSEKGPYSYRTLTRAMRVDFPKILTTEIIPNTAALLTLFMLWRFLSKGWKEHEEKNK